MQMRPPSFLIPHWGLGQSSLSEDVRKVGRGGAVWGLGIEVTVVSPEQKAQEVPGGWS